ncbi:hypothetical protein [Halopelagius longus]|uniref:DUF2238 domain-containing protein n=1 Tax=Halopelagius longus TaxID=1236180 RepID=A0A1H0XUF7_9EURY|nr:hypothetical protein [Halopelagius longus]RDI72097.1 hypothetical protein DWB78_10430 [Halopelagius longus]SDQ06479.1 hypothetical protein SAMN05216278_0194 [Halopelagius longus]
MNARRRSLPARHAVRAMQFGIVGILVAGVLARNVSVAVNGLFAFAVTFLPSVLSRDWGIRLSPGLTLWITLAVFLHAVGMLGLYDGVWWYDHVTHTLSATIVAGVGYATARAVDRYTDTVHLPRRFMFVFIVTFTLAFGVFWEVLEFFARLSADAVGAEAVLVQYGLDDTIVDLLFDSVGAVLVGLFGTNTLATAVDSVHKRIEEARAG